MILGNSAASAKVREIEHKNLS